MIDKKSNEKIDQFIDNYNSSTKKFSNKIIFKNFIKDLISAYSG